jgi:integrase
MGNTINRKKVDENKRDLFGFLVDFDKLYKMLENSTAFSIPENNKIIKKFIDAKWKGNYRSIIYQVNDPAATLSKNIHVFRTLERCLGKSFESLTQDDVDNFQIKLNSDSFETTNRYIEKKKMSFRYKQDLVKHLKQFWKYYRLYAKSELQKEMPDIVEYIKVRRQKDQNKFIEFLTKEDIDTLILHTSSQQMKSFLAIYFELGTRSVEILLLKKCNTMYDEKKKVWIIHPPNEKGISTAKMPIELSFANYEFNKWMTIRSDMLENDFVFDYSYEYIRKYLSVQGKKILNKHVTPKQMRKGTTMYLINSNANEQYIRAHMGWSANSDAIKSYICQIAIKRPDTLKKAIQDDFYSDMVKENEDLRLKQKLFEETMKKMNQEMEEYKKEQLLLFSQMKNINISSSKNLVMTIIEELEKNKNGNSI